MVELLTFIVLLTNAVLCCGVNINSNDELWYWLCAAPSTFPGDSYQLYLVKTSYYLKNSTFCVISDTHNFTLKSLTGNSSIYCSPSIGNETSTFGIGFVNVSEIHIENIHFYGCGSTITPEAVVMINDSHPHIGYLQKAVFTFNHCYNINIKHVSINSYSGYAVIIVNPMGHSLLHDVQVFNGVGANHQSCEAYSCAGSGIVCLFKDTNHTSDLSSVELTKSVIKMNLNIIPDIPPLNLIGHGLCTLPLIGAAGLTLIFNQSYKAVFSCKDTHIGNTCGGTVAGNLLLLYYNGMFNSQANFSNSYFWSGFLLPNTNQIGGSGITALSLLCGSCLPHDYDNSSWMPLYIHNSKITGAGNGDQFVADKFASIQYGGGFYLNIIEACGPKSIYIFLNIATHLNYAYKSGSVLYASLSEDVRKSKMTHLSLILDENEVYFGLRAYSIYATYSTLPCITLVNWNNVTIRGGRFHDNNAPVIAAYNSEIHFTGKALFANNKGVNGAAIYLQSSFLILEEPLNATFCNNIALLYGGAVYADNGVTPSQQRCALQIRRNQNQSLHTKLNIKLNFQHNEAGLAGNSMYINPLYNCSVFYPSIATLDIPFFDWNTIITLRSLTRNGINEVSSEPVKVCSCTSNGTGLLITCPFNNIVPNPINTYPGKTLVVSLCAVDTSGRIVYSAAIASIASDKYTNGNVTQEYLYLLQEQRLVPLSGKNFTRVFYNIYNKVTIARHVFLSIATPSNPPSWSAHVYIQPCPLGFALKEDQCICDQLITDIAPGTQCNITSTTILISSGQWLGNVSNTTLGFSFLCPPGNCQKDISYVNVTDPSSLCVKNKEGVLCGQCRDGLSVVFGASECQECSDLWALTIIGYIISGLVLVGIMLALPLTISEGPLAGIVIAMNLTAASTIDVLDGDHWFLYMARVSVSIVNLSLGFPICLYNGMTPVIKTGLLFAYPVYLWVLIIVFIVFSKHSTLVSNRTASHSVQVLASLMYLSFSKILMTCIDIIAYIPVHTADNGTMTVWYGDGSVSYLASLQHLILFLLSLAGLLLYVLPFILFVTFGGHCLRWRCVSKYLRQFLEAFQGPYKQRRRYWFGVRVWVVTYIYLLWAVLRGYSITLMLFMQWLPMSVLCCCQLYLKPFRSPLLNIVDSLCLALSFCQVSLAITFSGRALSFAIASLNLILIIGLLSVIGWQLVKKIKCFSFTETDRDRSRVNGQEEVVETDEMRKFLLDMVDD